MLEGTSLEISLTYLNAAAERVPVATTRVANGPGASDGTALVDPGGFGSHGPGFDPWAGKPLGIRFLSTVDAAQAGGYWDLDHVRLQDLREPSVAGISLSGNQVNLVVEGEPGAVVDLLEGGDPGQPVDGWTVTASATNATGRTTFGCPGGGSELGRFFRVRQRP